MIKCKFCGDLEKDNRYGGYCQSCYKYFVLDKKKAYNVAPYGEMARNEDDEVICNICGKAYGKLGAHLFNKHHLTSKEAYKLFGWDMNPRATSDKYREHMRDVLQPKCVADNLIKGGMNTRFKKGDSGRTIDMVSPMTMNRLKQSSFIKKK